MENNNPIIYLDYNATTPIDKRVLDAMMPFLTYEFANANSTHAFGVNAYNAVKSARSQVSELIGADAHEIIFTSGSTEAINLAIKGVAENYRSNGQHIVTVATEHYAVLDTCRHLETKGFEVTYLSVQPDGVIDLSELESALRDDTILVCVMLANNETGVIQPVKEIAELSHKVGALFMSDATQAVGKIPVNVDDLGIDLLCLSGHKFYAPKGIGALYVRQRINRVRIPALLHGGGHEKGLRSGTLNVPGIVAIGRACEIARDEMKEDAERMSVLRNELEKVMLNFPNTFENGSTETRMYNVSNICFSGHDANVLIGRMKNVAVSNGSACSSALVKPSHVLTAMGLSDDDALASIRFSMGKFSTESDVQAVSKIYSHHFINSPLKYA